MKQNILNMKPHECRIMVAKAIVREMTGCAMSLASHLPGLSAGVILVFKVTCDQHGVSFFPAFPLSHLKAFCENEFESLLGE